MQKTLKKPPDWRRIFFLLSVAVVVLAAWWFASRIPRTMAIFAVAAFIAFGAHPLVSKLDRHNIPRPWGIALVFTVLGLIIAFGLLLVVPLTIGQIHVLADNAPSFVASLQSWISGAQDWVQQKFPSIQIPNSAFDLSQLSGAHLSTFTTTTFTSALAVLQGTATAFFVGFSALILSIFFLLSDRQVKESFVALFPVSKRKTAEVVGSEIAVLFGSYISGQVIVCAITGIVVGVAGWLMGFHFALILGIIAGVAYAIPIFGMLVAQLIGLLLCAPQGPWIVIWMQVVMFGMARISDNVLVPKIMGDSVGVSPIGVMFAVFAGGELFGLPGLLLGIPAAALIKILWRYFFGPWIQKQLDSE